MHTPIFIPIKKTCLMSVSVYTTYYIYVQTQVFESHMLNRAKRKQKQRGIT